MKTNALYSGFMITSMVLGFIAAIALIIGGIGLRGGKAYGRTLSIAYAIYAIIYGVAGTAFNVMFLVEPMMEQLPEGPGRGVATAVVLGSMVGGGVCGLVYPIVLLVFMLRGPVINYLRAQHQA
jgi:hypothetical protein